MALTTTQRPVAGIRDDADIAEVRARDAVQIGHVTRFVKPDERLVGVLLLVDGDDFRAGQGLGEAEINGFENAAVDRQQAAR